MDIETRVLNPLDTPAQAKAFDRFVSIYEQAFPVDDERENPSRWRERIEAGLGGRSVTTVIVCGHDLLDKDRMVVTGGIVTEVYLASGTGLVSYLAVAPEARGTGAARALVEAAEEAFDATAAAVAATTHRPFEVRAVFAEAEDPRRYDDPDERAAVAQRLEVLAHFGARWVDVPYLQPALGPDRSPIDLLLLVVPRPGQSPYVVRADVVAAFLADLYRTDDDAAGTDPRVLHRWHAIRARLADLAVEADTGAPSEGASRPLEGGYVVLRTPPVREDPVLALSRVAIALHVASAEVALPEGPDGRPLEGRRAAPAALEGHPLWSSLPPTTPVTVCDGPPETFCPIFNSFEIDILDYNAIQTRPVTSVCYTESPRAVEIHVPERTDYLAEGRGVTWYGARTPIPARLALSFSRFPDSGVRVWHVALRPPAGGAFSELDLIKLITLYDGRQERPNIPAGLRLSTPGGPPLSPDAFLAELTEGALVGAAFTAGSVEIELADTDGAVDWGELFEAAGAPPGGAPSLHDVLAKYIGGGEVASRLLAASGVVQGIFDYGRLSVGELGAVFRPVVRSSSSGWLSINCATLLDVSVGEGFLDVTADTVGVSPYRLVPHAVVLHNEFVGRAAEAHTDRAATSTDLTTLAHAASAADRLLRRLTVPDPFLYDSERHLFDRITEHRGTTTQRVLALSKVEELEGRLDREKVLMAERRAHWLAAFLGLFSLVAVLDVVDFANAYRAGVPLPPAVVVGLIVGTGALLAGLYVLARPRR